MVNLSDNAYLMAKFLALPFPRMFMYGEQNRSLTYLPHLAANGVQLAEITRSGHFPMYSNAPGDVERNRSLPAPDSYGNGTMACSPGSHSPTISMAHNDVQPEPSGETQMQAPQHERAGRRKIALSGPLVVSG